MYSYAKDCDRPRTYRPDILPLIKHWLSTVPETAWEHFVAFRAGERGEFVAKFMKQPTRGGPLRVVTFTLDHNRATMATDCGCWVSAEPVAFNPDNFEHAVNTF